MICKYRSRVPVVMGLFGASLFLIVGSAMVVPTSTSDVSEHVIGGFAIAVACWVGGISCTNVVLLTPQGIVHRHTFRRTVTPWDAVESFKAARAPRRQQGWTVQVELRPLGHSYLTAVAGSEKHIQRIIAEFEGYRVRLGEAGVSPEAA